MKQKFHHYKLWEDYLNGMYNTDFEYIHIENAEKMLKDNNLFHNTCIELLKNWKFASDVNMTNCDVNRRAWLGAAACCYKFDVPEIATRIAWNKLTDNEKESANKVAQNIINDYEIKANNNAKTQLRIECF